MENTKKKITLLHNFKFYLLVTFLSLCYALIMINVPSKINYSLNEDSIIGKIDDIKIGDDKTKLLINGKDKVLCNYYYKNDSDKNNIQRIKFGMEVKLTIELKEPKNNTVPNNFNYKEYLYNHKIYYICTIKKMKITKSNVSLFYNIKNSIIKRCNSFKKIGPYLLTFIIGDKSNLDNDIINSYKDNGISHLFAISGMHIGLFSLLILTILKKLKMSINKSYIITISFIWFYAFLTGFSSSVLRAGLLFTLLSINKLFNLNIKSIYVLVLTGCILIVINPLIIKDIGFIYSFTTTFGLMYSSKIIKKYKVIGVSLIAFLVSLPITINNFYEFNILSIIINIIFVPYVSIIVYPICLLTYIFSFLEPITYFSLNIMEYLSTHLVGIDYFRIVMPKMNIFMVIIYYLIFFILVNKRFKLCVVILCLILSVNSNKYLLDDSFHVEFLDVSQGDSILIRYPKNNKIVLIDTGGIVSFNNTNTYKVSDSTITYLKSLGVKTIDHMIISHGDYDHMGEAINLVNNFKVEKVIFNCGPYNDLENELIKVLDKKKIKYYSCIKELNIGKNKLHFLQTKEYDNENDNSNVIITELNGYKFMFMGDASVTTEHEILDKYNLSDIDVLKVGHHGSRTSSSKEFINEINPKYSIISVGKNNRYGHPNKEILDNLNNSKIYRTDENGSIMFKIKNNKLKIETCSP